MMKTDHIAVIAALILCISNPLKGNEITLSLSCTGDEDIFNGYSEEDKYGLLCFLRMLDVINDSLKIDNESERNETITLYLENGKITSAKFDDRLKIKKTSYIDSSKTIYMIGKDSIDSILINSAWANSKPEGANVKVVVGEPKNKEEKLVLFGRNENDSNIIRKEDLKEIGVFFKNDSTETEGDSSANQVKLPFIERNELMNNYYLIKDTEPDYSFTDSATFYKLSGNGLNEISMEYNPDENKVQSLKINESNFTKAYDDWKSQVDSTSDAKMGLITSIIPVTNSISDRTIKIEDKRSGNKRIDGLPDNSSGKDSTRNDFSRPFTLAHHKNGDIDTTLFYSSSQLDTNIIIELPDSGQPSFYVALEWFGGILLLGLSIFKWV